MSAAAIQIVLSAKDNLLAAIVRVTDSAKGWAPYLGPVLRGLVRCEMPADMCAALEAANGMATLAVTEDGILFWAPKFTRESPTEELALGLIHECMHVILKHHERCRALKVPPDLLPLVNLCEDASINDEVRKIKQPPAWWVYPETLEQPVALSFEQRYRLLGKDACKQLKAGKGRVGNGWCGSCAGRPVPGEPKSAKAVGGRSEAEMARIRKETAEAVRQHNGKRPGTVPASLSRWADEELAPPKIDWRAKLTQAVRSAIAYRPGAVDFDWTRPSRRQAALGYGVGRPIVPSYRAPVPQVACIVDTSGSMGSAELQEAAAEISGVLAATNAAITVCACDAEVHALREVKTVQEAVKLFIGGGGTSMIPAFATLAERRPQPEVAIVLTDGFIGDPGPEPPFSVVWCIAGGNATFTAPFGEVVIVEREAKAP